jgi:hypothetical protein
LTLVTLLGTDAAEARAAAADARSVFERVGARPFLARLAAAEDAQGVAAQRSPAAGRHSESRTPVV